LPSVISGRPATLDAGLDRRQLGLGLRTILTRSDERAQHALFTPLGFTALRDLARLGE
jgi:hypothetical protein